MKIMKNRLLPHKILAVLLAFCLLISCTPTVPSAPGASRGKKDTFTICVDGDDILTKQQRKAFEDAYPEIEFIYVRVPDYTYENQTDEGISGNMSRLRAQIMSGQGPDLFLLSAENPLLFADPYKHMGAGVFLDLSPYMAELSQGLHLNEALLTAGTMNGAQYLLPLSCMVLCLVADNNDFSGCGAESGDAPAGFLQKLLDYYGEKPFACGLGIPSVLPSRALGRPVLDYETNTVVLDEEAQRYFSLLARSMSLRENLGDTAYNVSDFPSEIFPFIIGILGGDFNVERAAYQLLCLEDPPLILPIPNGQGGVTACVDFYAGVRANSSNVSLAVALLRSLIETDTMTDTLGNGGIGFALPLNRDALRPIYEKAFLPETSLLNGRLGLDCSVIINQCTIVYNQINKARFCRLEDELLYENVLIPVCTSRTSIEEAAINFSQKYRFYFDE